MRTGIFLLLVLSLVSVISGSTDELRRKRQVPSNEDCMKPPMKRLAHECCQLPREKIWGDLRSSLDKCMGQRTPPRQEMEGDGELVTVPPQGSPEMTPSTEAAPSSPQPGFPGRHGRPHRRKAYFIHRRPKDQCFMECVFEDQGFLVDKKVNKDAMLERLNRTLGRNEVWHKVAVEALETCHETEPPKIPSNSTCASGSEEIFRCVFKQIFFNCPTWPQRNQYCSSLKNFYQKCPDGPPPEMDDQTTPVPEETSEDSPSTVRYPDP